MTEILIIFNDKIKWPASHHLRNGYVTDTEAIKIDFRTKSAETKWRCDIGAVVAASSNEFDKQIC